MKKKKGIKKSRDRMIRIGTLAGKGKRTAEYIRKIAGYGFESYQINFWQTLEGVNLKELASELKPTLEEYDSKVSSLGVFGNPLGTSKLDKQGVAAWRSAIDHAHLFGTDLVCGFAGRVRDCSVPDSIKTYKKVFTPLLKHAQDKGVRIAFENCPMGGNWQTGDWNIAFHPDAWELMFDATPFENVGLEWEPCHQLCQLMDPIPQLRKWIDKVFHVHGKDASVYRDVIAEKGICGDHSIAHHRHPGFGDTDWKQIIDILCAANYTSTIDIEGWHDPYYQNDLEMTGQVHALNYLKQCRGGEYVANPKGF
ncbi:MAG: sugar phosphate isomerase/epimerase family protein [Verrucomicrobiota bacterium]